MRRFKFFRGVQFTGDSIWDQRVPLATAHPTINDAIRHEEYLNNIEVRNESLVDWGRMAREIQEEARLREMINRPIDIPEDFQHRGRRPRNPY